MSKEVHSTVELKNGAHEPVAIVMTTMLVLERLLQPKEDVLDVLSFYELVMKSRDPSHEIFSEEHAARLQSLGMLDAGGRVHSSIANVVKSAVVGDELDMTLTCPFARDTEYVFTADSLRGEGATHEAERIADHLRRFGYTVSAVSVGEGAIRVRVNTALSPIHLRAIIHHYGVGSPGHDRAGRPGA